MYIVKRGFMDGTAGFTYSVLMAFYELLIVLKIKELLGKDTVWRPARPASDPMEDSTESKVESAKSR
jgi:hypothetical protein